MSSVQFANKTVGSATMEENGDAYLLKLSILIEDGELHQESTMEVQHLDLVSNQKLADSVLAENSAASLNDGGLP